MLKEDLRDDGESLSASSGPPHQCQPKSSGRIPALDGWRGIAIALVLIEHTVWGACGRNPFGMLGQHGVAIFFVLSGYLITSKLRDEYAMHGSIDLRRFYVRRFFRLMPAAWLYLTIATSLVAMSGVHLKASELLGCILFFRNYVHGGTTLTSHFWTLSLEEQFYLTWPALLLFLRPRRATWIACGLAAAIALNRFLNESHLLAPPYWHVYETQYRADALLVGCISALLQPRIRLRPWTVFPLLGVLCCCIIRYNVFVPLGEPVVIALLLVSTSNSTPLRGVLASKPLTFLGAISYSLYLWQQAFLLSFAGKGAVEVAVNLAMLFAIATISHYWLEAPLLQLGRRIAIGRADSQILKPAIAPASVPAGDA